MIQEYQSQYFLNNILALLNYINKNIVYLEIVIECWLIRYHRIALIARNAKEKSILFILTYPK